MTISMAGTEARLDGDWTMSGVTKNIHLLALSLQQLEPCDTKSLRIDCGQMKEADISGLQILNVWVECAQIRGMEPFFVNVPDKLRHSMQMLLGQRIMDARSDAAMMAG